MCVCLSFNSDATFLLDVTSYSFTEHIIITILSTNCVSIKTTSSILSPSVDAALIVSLYSRRLTHQARIRVTRRTSSSRRIKFAKVPRILTAQMTSDCTVLSLTFIFFRRLPKIPEFRNRSGLYKYGLFDKIDNITISNICSN